jgi:glyceraldehyde 3-phosphate dehydrogenase
MAKIKVGINGFGRIGRLVLRYAMDNPDIEVVAVNDVADINVLAYLLQYDSAYGRFPGTVVAEGNALVVNGQPVRYTTVADPTQIPWGDMGVSYVVESTGLFTETTTEKKDPRKHMKGGARRVVVSAPAKAEADVKTVVMGVNHGEYDPARHTLLSNASCTTNCLAPVVKVLQDNWGIESGLMTTIHAATASQKAVDGPSKKFDPLGVRSGRTLLNNIIPASTGAAKAIALVIPAVKGKLTGMAMRVPTITGSVVDLTVQLKSDATLDLIGAKMEEAANTPMDKGGMQGILGFSKDPLVSSDIIGDRRSSLFDYNACIAFPDNKRFFKLVSWYDNECGYANRVVDLLAFMAKKEN